VDLDEEAIYEDRNVRSPDGRKVEAHQDGLGSVRCFADYGAVSVFLGNQQ
jgi:hypothetical protein